MDQIKKEVFLFRKCMLIALQCLPFLLFAALLFLCFYFSPVADDLSIHYYSGEQGILPFLKTYYREAGSRYLSFPVLTLICHSRFLMDHYWMIPFFSMLLFWLILKAAIKPVIQVLNERISSIWVSWLATLLFLTLCSVIFEISSFFYWISGIVNYMPSFLLFVLLLKTVLPSLKEERQKTISYPVAVILVLCICGTNEFALYFLILFLIWIQYLFYSIHRKTNLLLGVCLISSLACLFFLILPSGVSQRAGHFKLNFSIFHAGIVSVSYTVRMVLRIVSSPFAWISLLLAVLAGTCTRKGTKEKLVRLSCMNPRLNVLLLLATILFFYFMIYIFSGELLTPRAHNLIMVYFFSALLFCGYAYGLQITLPFPVVILFFRNGAFPLLMILVILSSALTNEIFYNLFSAPIHNRVVEERKTAIQNAILDGRHAVELNPYAIDFAMQGKKLLPPFFHHILRKKILTIPDWMRFQDPVEDTALYIHYYAEFQHIDTIRFQGVDYERVGLQEKSSPR